MLVMDLAPPPVFYSGDRFGIELTAFLLSSVHSVFPLFPSPLKEFDQTTTTNFDSQQLARRDPEGFNDIPFPFFNMIPHSDNVSNQLRKAV